MADVHSGYNHQFRNVFHLFELTFNFSLSFDCSFQFPPYQVVGWAWAEMWSWAWIAVYFILNADTNVITERCFFIPRYWIVGPSFASTCSSSLSAFILLPNPLVRLLFVALLQFISIFSIKYHGVIVEQETECSLVLSSLDNGHHFYAHFVHIALVCMSIWTDHVIMRIPRVPNLFIYSSFRR